MPKGSKSLATITAPIFCSEIILATSETCVERRTAGTGALAIDPAVTVDMSKARAPIRFSPS